MYSLRRTLAVRFSLTLFLALVFIGVWTFLGVHRTLREQLDRSLATARGLALDILASGVPLPPHPGYSADTVAFVDQLNRLIVVRDGTGRVTASNSPLGANLSLDSASFMGAVSGQTVWSTRPWGSRWIRSLYAPIPAGLVAGGAVMQVAASTEPLARANRETLLVIVGTMLLSLVATAFGATWLARSAVAPVGEIADQAEGIGPRVNGQRITAHADVEELRSLVTVLNGMLERLDAAFAAQQRMVANVGHDLRTPLTSMRGHVEVALRGERDAEAYRRVLRSVLEDVDHLSSISESLILLARLESGALVVGTEPVNLGDLAADAVRRSEPRAGGRRFLLEDVGAPVMVRGDRAMLALVLDHLLDNTIRHTPSGTTVETRVRSNGGAQLVMRDDGPGIPPESLGNLFRTFYRADEARTRAVGGGVAGLGLTISAAIIEAHGGQITAGNAVPRGLEVRISLPLAPAR
ncbi:MAG TPA: ATP-binding protein [Gemmatimonadales bacterium]|nr:ATP-binding protein [Gemmatimonadales bacterium]